MFGFFNIRFGRTRHSGVIHFIFFTGIRFPVYIGEWKSWGTCRRNILIIVMFWLGILGRGRNSKTKCSQVVYKFASHAFWCMLIVNSCSLGTFKVIEDKYFVNVLMAYLWLLFFWHHGIDCWTFRCSKNTIIYLTAAALHLYILSSKKMISSSHYQYKDKCYLICEGAITSDVYILHLPFWLNLSLEIKSDVV